MTLSALLNLLLGHTCGVNVNLDDLVIYLVSSYFTITWYQLKTLGMAMEGTMFHHDCLFPLEAYICSQ